MPNTHSMTHRLVWLDRVTLDELDSLRKFEYKIRRELGVGIGGRG